MLGILLVLLGLSFAPNLALAGEFGGGGLESRMDNLQSKFINVILPIMSILGLVYAGIIAASGNEGAKAKILVILIGSIVGFLAPHIILWIKGILT